MALLISPQDIYQALLPWFGRAFVEESGVVNTTSKTLHFFSDKKGDFAQLLTIIEKDLFMHFYQWSKGTMKLHIKGESYRIHSSAFATIADDVLALYFLALRPTPIHFELIKRHSLERESLAALKALYLNYPHLQSPQECAVIKRMITGIYPPWRYEQWLKEEAEGPST